MAMEKENSANFTYMGRSFSELTVNDDSLAFSDCNSDKSGEFPASASQSRRLFLSCAADNPDDLIWVAEAKGDCGFDTVADL
ncbi:U BOX DOMAIN-CONTAINING [Salix purpurea]|uniref:U BOX DOMAIN-CONTAINING n=1 Tax=Salix purpurea TaxID=77065 RepID=A0A9Q0PCT2_SALPP|nr:U BOX DOMAIN-CONTAINING [Salix purpurea]